MRRSPPICNLQSAICNAERGAASIFLVFLMSMVLLGMLALAVDVGRMYVIQSEIQAAADASALAAATQLIGTANSQSHATVSGNAPLDPTNNNDNRFNLRANSLSQSSDLASSVSLDYFTFVNDAKSGINGGQSGPDAHYARVDVQVQSPTLFTRFFTSDTNKPQVRAAAVAGISSPLCQVCGVDDIAVNAIDLADSDNFGFLPGEFYTLCLTPNQRTANPTCTAVAPLTDTLQNAEYTILNHTPPGPDTDTAGLLFRLGAGGIAPVSSDATLSACINIGAGETPLPGLQGTVTAARNLRCGLNTRFGVDPTGNAICSAIASVTDLASLFSADTDIGPAALQTYNTDYDGNARRVITVAVVSDSTTLAVLNFRQFLLEGDPNTVGLNVTAAATGLVRAQYIGTPVPVRLGSTAGSCSITRGVGKVVLF